MYTKLGAAQCSINSVTNLIATTTHAEQYATLISKDSCDTPVTKCQALDATDHYDDVAKYISHQSHTAESRYNLLTNHFKPPYDYGFSKGTKGH